MIPNIRFIYRKNRKYLLFEDNLNEVLESVEEKTSTDVHLLFKAAKVLRTDIFNAKQSFTGEFNSARIKDSIPSLCYMFIHMVLDVPGLDKPAPSPEISRVVSSIGNEAISLNRE